MPVWNTNMSRKNSIELLCYIVAFAAIFVVRNQPFFWDTIQLGSKHAHWYYENAFAHFFLPQTIDSGHPPAFGMYLAALWIVFGKTLAVSHFAMLPFVFGSIYYWYRIGNLLAPGQAIFLLLLLYADPVLATQSILISPDLVLICFFAMGLYGILFDKPVIKGLAVVGLGLVSLRGMMVGLALYLFELLRVRPFRVSDAWRILPAYLPGGLIGIAFLYAHYRYAGWIGYHMDSPWADSLERVDLIGVFKNTAIIAWRFLDFGRLLIWPVLLVLLLAAKRQALYSVFSRTLLTLFAAGFLVLTPSLLLHSHLSAHRYLLPLFVSLNLLLFYLVFGIRWKKGRYQKLLYLVVAGSLTGGNLWIYPNHIAQGWDATLAHLPYQNLRSKMIRHLDQERIPLEQVGTAFPEIGPQRIKDLGSRSDGFITKDLSSNQYVFYSNIMNDFSDRELDELEKKWTVIKAFEQNGIFAFLYQKN